eukprot:CAMPEP_0174313318 /NCGR_PEP_ID=MMETSP0810-20121108/4900_1 /TAXON_ID=73025 ORGANISM="Eutreptiella gymnastica-like, Strain CCMP1594" /NCGR_SAMPLE_ID=MMETSP0810 /ASSEMBLY_ACC=CAM_ASM_000659 /LENGTH=36 /DNA_ID= /DNA_START= /DNA_END= /DNA_ORIENTATION=
MSQTRQYMIGYDIAEAQRAMQKQPIHTGGIYEKKLP